MPTGAPDNRKTAVEVDRSDASPRRHRQRPDLGDDPDGVHTAPSVRALAPFTPVTSFANGIPRAVATVAPTRYDRTPGPPDRWRQHAGAATVRAGAAPRKTADTIVLPAAAPVGRRQSTVRRSSAPTHERVHPGRWVLISPGVGWALNGLALYRTVDDTAHWTNITPPGVTDAIAHIRAIDFLDADHAWLAVALDNQPFTIDRTADGGRSWQAIRPERMRMRRRPSSGACGTPVAIDFIDRTRGWAVFSANDTSGTLLATVDGGTTWTVVGPTPFVGALHFTDASTAWGTGGRGGVYRTTDGGKTWRQVAVPAGATGATVWPIGAAQFFGRNGVVATRLTLRRTQPPVLTVYSSRDGGSTWTAQAAPVDPGVNVVNDVDYRFSAATPSDWALLFGTRAVAHARRRTALVEAHADDRPARRDPPHRSLLGVAAGDGGVVHDTARRLRQHAAPAHHRRRQDLAVGVTDDRDHRRAPAVIGAGRGRGSSAVRNQPAGEADGAAGRVAVALRVAERQHRAVGREDRVAAPGRRRRDRDRGQAQAPPRARAEELRVAEAEDPAVARDQPVAVARRRRAHRDDRVD